MMTTETQKTSNKRVCDVSVVVLYEKNNITAYRVHITQGKFVVIDYKDRFGKSPDTEIFWENGAILILPHTNEYKYANTAVNVFLRDKKINKSK
jgi:hypothetical protein